MAMYSLVKEDLSVNFDEIEDPRINRRKLYPLSEVLFLALFGALLGIESWRGLELLGIEGDWPSPNHYLEIR